MKHNSILRVLHREGSLRTGYNEALNEARPTKRINTHDAKLESKRFDEFRQQHQRMMERVQKQRTEQPGDTICSPHARSATPRWRHYPRRRGCSKQSCSHSRMVSSHYLRRTASRFCRTSHQQRCTCRTTHPGSVTCSAT